MRHEVTVNHLTHARTRAHTPYTPAHRYTHPVIKLNLKTVCEVFSKKTEIFELQQHIHTHTYF
jgi:hypothetical protein